MYICAICIINAGRNESRRSWILASHDLPSPTDRWKITENAFERKRNGRSCRPGNGWRLSPKAKMLLMKPATSDTRSRPERLLTLLMNGVTLLVQYRRSPSTVSESGGKPVTNTRTIHTFRLNTTIKPGFHPNAIACVACVAFGCCSQ